MNSSENNATFGDSTIVNPEYISPAKRGQINLGVFRALLDDSIYLDAEVLPYNNFEASLEVPASEWFSLSSPEKDWVYVVRFLSPAARSEWMLQKFFLNHVLFTSVHYSTDYYDYTEDYELEDEEENRALHFVTPKLAVIEFDELPFFPSFSNLPSGGLSRVGCIIEAAENLYTHGLAGIRLFTEYETIPISKLTPYHQATPETLFSTYFTWNDDGFPELRDNFEELPAPQIDLYDDKGNLRRLDFAYYQDIPEIYSTFQALQSIEQRLVEFKPDYMTMADRGLANFDSFGRRIEQLDPETRGRILPLLRDQDLVNSVDNLTTATMTFELETRLISLVSGYTECLF